MDDEIKISKIILKVAWQGALSFFIGAGLFYLAAPHSTDHGTMFIETFLLLSLVGLAFVIVTTLKFILKNKITFVCFVAFSAGVIITQYYYPISDRRVEPSVIVEQKIRMTLERENTNIKSIEVSTRAKRSFDLMRPKIWVVTVYTNDDSFYQKVYVKESLAGEFSISK